MINKAWEYLAELEAGLGLLQQQQLAGAVELALVNLDTAIDAQAVVRTESNPQDVQAHRSQAAVPPRVKLGCAQLWALL